MKRQIEHLLARTMASSKYLLDGAHKGNVSGVSACSCALQVECDGKKGRSKTNATADARGKP